MRPDMAHIRAGAVRPFVTVAGGQLYPLGQLGLLSFYGVVGGSDATEVTLRSGGPAGTIIARITGGIGHNAVAHNLRFVDGLHVTITGTDAIFQGCGPIRGLNEALLAAAVTVNTPAGGGSAPVTSGLVAHHDASQIVGLNDQDDVAQWDDISGEDNHLDGSSVPPDYRDGAVVGINGLPCIEFAGGASNEFLAYTTFFMAAETEGEIFIVLEAQNDPAAAVDDSGLWTSSAPDFGDHYPFTDGVIYEDWGTTLRKTVGNPAAPLTAPHVYNVYSAPNDWQAFLDNVSLFSTVTNTVSFRGSGAVMRYGVSISNNSFNGRIGEIMLYNRKLTTEERTAVHDYLAAKWIP